MTEGTEEYRKKLEELTKEQLNYYALIAQASSNAAKENLKVYGSDLANRTIRFDDSTLAEIARDKGFITAEWFGGDIIALSDNIFEQEKQLQDFATLLNEIGYGDTDIFTNVVNALKNVNDAIDTNLNDLINGEYYPYINENGVVDTQAEFDEVVNQIMEASGATEDWRDEIEGIVEELSDFNNQVDEVLDDQVKKLENLTDEHMDELIEKLKEMRDIEEDSNKLEERKRDILEAQQKVLEKQKALEDAKNNRTIRTFNSATGQFEWTVDQEKIQTAEDELAEAQEELNDAIEAVRNEAWDSVIEELESGNATNESVKEILDEWKAVAELQADADISWYKEIVDAIKSISNVNIGASDISAVSYDNGGIASGLGYMPKATAEPEAINDPVLTAKILSPVSNAEFDRYVKDMGILFNTAREYTNIRPVMQSTVGATTNTTNNNSVSINGLKIGTDMLNTPFIEVLKMATTLVPRRK